MRTAQDEMLAASVQFVVKVFQRVESGRIHSQNLAHSENENFWFLARPLQSRFQLVGSTEEKRAKHTEHQDPIRHLLANQRMMRTFGLGRLVHRRNLCG